MVRRLINLRGGVGAPESGESEVGLEHEFRVLAGCEQMDFRSLVHDLRLGQPYLDPGDPNAYRMSFGAVFTADGAEAEIALPPLSVRPGVIPELVSRARYARAQLAQLLPDKQLCGYSTHISVSVPTRLADEVAREYAVTFAPAMMLLLDRDYSPGLLVRPRPGRLELGGEFADGRALAAAAAFAVGGVLACVEAVQRGRSPDVADLAVSLVPDDQRYGWFVSRHAFGGDLYVSRREADLPLAAGGTVTAQRHLEACRDAASAVLTRLALSDDVEQLERTVNGDLPLPSEASNPSEAATPPRVRGSVFGDILACRMRAGYQLSPVMATWDTTVMLALQPETGGRLFVNVPRRALPSFIEALDRGDLDADINRRFQHRRAYRTLRRHAQTTRLGYYRRLGSRQGLLAKERGPMVTGRAFV